MAKRTMKAMAAILAPVLLLSIQAPAKGLFDGLMDQAGALMKEAEKMATSTEGMTPLSNSQRYSGRFSANASAIDELRLESSNFTEPEFTTVPGNQIVIDIETASSTTDQTAARQLAEATKLRKSDGRLILDNSVGNYFCFRMSVNGAISIKGTCFTRLVIGLPQGSPLVVVDSKGKSLRGTKMWRSAEEVARAAQKESGSEQGKVVEDFMNQLRRTSSKISAEDLITIVTAYSFDNEKLKAFESLVPYLRRSERSVVADRMNEIFSFSSTKDQATRLLIR
jgi:hypothetical protein